METTVTESANKAKHMLMNVSDKASTAFNNTTSQLGKGMDSAAHKVADNIGRAAESVSHAGHYLQESSPADIRRDLTQVVKAHPKTSIAIGLGLGFLISRALFR